MFVSLSNPNEKAVMYYISALVNFFFFFLFFLLNAEANLGQV